MEVDNAASDRATIIEVYAHDRPGLLYDITRRLTALGLDIVLTKITTEVDQAADIFYVQDESGNKIIDFERLEEIRTSLHDHLVMEESNSEQKDAASFSENRNTKASLRARSLRTIVKTVPCGAIVQLPLAARGNDEPMSELP